MLFLVIPVEIRKSYTPLPVGLGFRVIYALAFRIRVKGHIFPCLRIRSYKFEANFPVP
jgi:hypothetical protein